MRNSLSYKGKSIESYSKEELVDIVLYLIGKSEEERDEYQRRLEFVSELKGINRVYDREV